MVVTFKNIPAYYLNRDIFEDRRLNMEKMFSELEMQYKRIPSNTVLTPRQNGMSVDLITLIETAISDNSYPFLIFEDDAQIIIPPPKEIEYPDETDLIYLGSSLYNCGGKKPDLQIRYYNENYYRIYYSLAGHALMVCNESAANIVLKAFKKSLEFNEYTDLGLALASSKHIFLTPVEGPFFYQNDAHTIPVTRFLWKDNLDKYLYPCQ
jgi:hypothetical protein